MRCPWVASLVMTSFIVGPGKCPTDAHCLQFVLKLSAANGLSLSSSDIREGAAVRAPTSSREFERNGSAKMRQRLPLLKVTQDHSLYRLFELGLEGATECKELLPLLALPCVSWKMFAPEASLAHTYFDQLRGTMACSA